MNGDLRVAYRASREGARDIVLVPAWFTNCEDLPEMPIIQGWAKAITSIGRLIIFDQPGIGASDPIPGGALPTLELWADSITAVLDALGSREAALISYGALPTAAMFAATHPSRTTALIVLEDYANPMAERTEGPNPEETLPPWSPCGGRASTCMQRIRTCRGTRKSGQRRHAGNAGPQVQEPLPSCSPYWPKWTCGRCFPPSACRHSSCITADDVRPARVGKGPR